MDKYNLGVIQSGFSKTVLYNGNPITSAGTYALSDSVYNYKLIIVEHGLEDGSTMTMKQTNVIIDIYNDTESYIVCHGNSSSNRYSKYHFSSDGNNIVIDSASGEGITKIIGIN